MITESFFKEGETRMAKVCEAFNTELGGFRTGRASTKLLEDLDVDAYGSRMKLKELATINVPEPHMLMVQPWDKTVAQAIEKAIRTSDLKLSPVSETGFIRVPIPPLSEERRREISKVVSKKAEESRVAVRNVRHDLLGKMQDQKKKGDATEDEEKRGKDRIQKMTDAEIRKIDDAMAKKIEEIGKV